MSEIYKNYFGPKSVAERYSKWRPNFHPFVVDQIKQFLVGRLSPRLVLDIGCGTGLSTAALADIGGTVVGIDISPEMIAFAPRTERIFYLCGRAEELPFDSNRFDLITFSQAIHWIDRSRFFERAKMVLKPNGWIVAFDNYFAGEIVDDERFVNWYRHRYLEHYPKTAKHEIAFQKEGKNDGDFVLAAEERHRNTIDLSHYELVNFLLTHSNVIAQVEGGTQTIDEATSWLTIETEHFFDGRATRTFTFNAPIWYLQRNSEQRKNPK